MAESKKLDTLVFCLGPVGGQENPVITKESDYASKFDYTTKGYARYVEEAKNAIEFQYLVMNYFLDSVQSEFEEDPFAFIDAEAKENLKNSVEKMRTQWQHMFKEHQKALKESFHHQKKKIEQAVADESGGSSAKIPRLDPEAATEAESKLPHLELKAMQEAASTHKFDYPENIFIKKAKDFARVLKVEYYDLRSRMGKALERIVGHVQHGPTNDLKGFTFQHMEKFAKWKYDLKTLGHLVDELESSLKQLDLDFREKKENENRLPEWFFFDDGKKDRRYHHRLLITSELTSSVAEISALTWKQIRRWKKLSKKLAAKLPTESEAFEEKVEQWKREFASHSPEKALQAQKSVESDDTMFGADEMPEET